MAHLIETQGYKSESRGFDSRSCHWNLTLIIIPAASNRNEYRQYFHGGKDGRCIGLRKVSPLFSDFIEILLPPPPGILRACPNQYRYCFTFTQC
jgi:hypothetical protein